jgi:quercetin dioxygenase-like cupin family protein
MKLLMPAAAFLGALAFAPVQANDAVQNISVTRSGSQPSSQGPGQFFTGAVRVDPLFPANAPSRVSGALVTFEPGARSAWHTHPVGQVLIVTAGRGLVQQWGGPAEEIRPGDVVRIPPSVKHWHGASPSTDMSHIAIQEALGGRNVDWLEQVSDGQYAQVKETR